jgi:hypothetical protein
VFADGDAATGNDRFHGEARIRCLTWRRALARRVTG